MPALKPTKFTAEIVWLGRVPVEGDSLPSAPEASLQLGFDGVAGERHSGLTRPSCSRVLGQHPRHTEIANVRQLSILSQEELDEIAARMGMTELSPHYMGASIVIKGLPDFTHVPPSSRLQAENGTTLVIDMENRPCVLPGREIEKDHEGFGARLKPAAEDRRGVTAWVERPGQLSVGDILTLHVPDQRIWNHYEAARSGG